jgi:hypothetical protein
MFPHLKLLCWLFMGPTLGFATWERNSFLIKFDVFYNKNKILTKLFVIKYEIITLLVTVFSIFGAHNQQFCLHVLMRNKKIIQNIKVCML